MALLIRLFSFYSILFSLAYFNLFAISKWLNFCFYILTKNQQTCQIKKMTLTKNYIDYYNMKVF